jgi:chondroitin-sulfate-ABC endolyase/exolyase
MDPQGHVYLVPQARLNCTRREQASLTPFGHDKPTSGFVSTALIDHGVQPENAAYEYSIFLNGGEDALRSAKASEYYRVLQMDDQAHVVQGLKEGLKGYAVMKGGDVKAEGLLKSSRHPLMVMIEEPKGDAVRLAYCDPNLLSEDEHVIELRGSWELSGRIVDMPELKVTVSGNITSIHTRCQDGLSYGIQLKRK